MEMSETAIVNGTLYVLAGFSLLTWSIVLIKAGEICVDRYRNGRFVRSYRELGQPPDGLLSRTQVGRVYQAGHATRDKSAVHLAMHPAHLEAWNELVLGSLRQAIQQEKARMEAGLGWLASIGSTAPFVGLFGTVWGIMHALKDISIKGNASLEVVAGPIGEALIATALGIAVAIPAVIAYNFFLRQNRRLARQLEQFAQDFLQETIETRLTQTTVNEHGHATLR